VHIPSFTLVILLLLSGCVSIQVERLTQDPYPPRSGTATVEPLDVEPSRPHVRLARIVATSEYATEETLREKILKQARPLGADAVVLRQGDVIETHGGWSSYQDTMASVHPGGDTLYGSWGTPFYWDPWTFAQGTSDHVDLVLYVSGIAIRYTDSEPAPEAAPSTPPE